MPSEALIKRRSRIWWSVLVLCMPAIILFALFKNIFACPECYLFESYADGLKNYYSVVYYVQHDQGWHFSGMNYPYGEHIIYTDNQPILALTLKWIDQNIIDMDHHVVGTINMLLILSIYFGVLLVYRILRRWEVGRWWAFASALCIIFLSPQLLRLHGHYGLAYVCMLPALILALDYMIRASHRRWIWAAGISGLVVVMSLLHMYFLFISVVILSSYALFWIWYNRKNKEYLMPRWPYLVASFLLPAFFMIMLRSATDHVTDRPKEPWGIDAFTVNFETTFLPFMPPMDRAWTEILKKKTRPDNEKIAYTGFIGLMMLPAFMYFFFRRQDDDFMNSHVKAFAGAAIGCWLMAAGVIYQNGFKFLWELVPMLKQFRGLGRFGFAFYYLYVLVCSYLIWRVYLLLRDRGLQNIGKYLLAGIFIFWAFESWLHIKAVRDPIFRPNKYLHHSKDDYVPLLQQAGKKPEDFQAILQFPLVAIGNETMGVSRGFWTMREGVHASVETGLPMIDYAMSRTSVSQGLDIVELISTPYHEKRRAALFDERPLLLLCEEDMVTAAERTWINKAEKIGTYETITLYSLPVDVLTTVQIPEIPEPSLTPPCDGWYMDFENTPTDTAMTGNGALVVTADMQLIWSYVDTSSVARDWNLAFWGFVDNYRTTVPVPKLVEKDPEGKILQNTGLHRDNILWAEAWQSWLQIAFPVRTQGKGYSYELFIEVKGPIIDNLMIWPAQDTCIIHTPEMILYNNLPVIK